MDSGWMLSSAHFESAEASHHPSGACCSVLSQRCVCVCVCCSVLSQRCVCVCVCVRVCVCVCVWSCGGESLCVCCSVLSQRCVCVCVCVPSAMRQCEIGRFLCLR